MTALFWPEQARDLRNRLLTSTRFQRWAAAFPLTRPIARRRARKLFDLCAGFVYSQVLLACVRLRLIEILAQQAQTPLALSERLGLPLDAMQRLLRAAAALELTEARPGGRYAVGPLGAALLGNPGLGPIPSPCCATARGNRPRCRITGPTPPRASPTRWTPIE